MIKAVQNCCFFCGSPLEVVTFTPAKEGEVADKICLSVKPCDACTTRFKNLGVVAMIEGRRMSKVDRALRARKFRAAEIVIRKPKADEADAAVTA